jgi:hypothetical protein
LSSSLKEKEAATTTTTTAEDDMCSCGHSRDLCMVDHGLVGYFLLRPLFDRLVPTYTKYTNRPQTGKLQTRLFNNIQ